MISAVALGVALLLVGFVPLFGGPGYEAALACGLLAPAWLSIVELRRTSARLQRVHTGADAVESSSSLFGLIGPIFVDWGVHASVVLGVVALQGLVQGYCEPWLGFGIFALGPIPGMLLGGMCGGGLGVLRAALGGDPARVQWFWHLLAVGPSLLSAAWAVARFYATPTVYAYDQFAGYFAGPLYDTVEYDLDRLLSFRASTLCLVLTVCAWSGLVRWRKRASGLKVSWADRGQRSTRLGLGVACLLGYASITAQGERLGHRGSAASIRAQLGGELQGARCRVVFSRGVLTPAAQRVGAECEQQLRQHREYFGLAEVRPVVVYLFADSAEKRRLMGAGRTNIAKPWRREVYITNDGFPHPVLGHELAHVVTGAFGRGPFRVAGELAGLVVDPGRVEGFAEAAALREGSFGTLREWAAAMKRVGRLPGLGQLFQLGFLGQSAARSYTAAGAFVQFVRDEWGAEVLRRWYGGASLDGLTRRSWAELERMWHAELESTAVPGGVLAAAAPKFSRPGLFERKCPHAFDRTLNELGANCGRRDAEVKSALRQLLKWDPDQVELQFEVPRCLAMSGKLESARRLTERLLDRLQLEPHEERRARDLLGDLAWKEGRPTAAAAEYQRADELNFEPAQERQIEVKLWALDQPAPLQRALLSLFFPDQTSEWTAPGVLGRWYGSGPDRALAGYLLMRGAMTGQRWDEARSWASEVTPAQLPLASLRKEFAHMQVVVACESAMTGGSLGPLEDAWRVYRTFQLSRAEEVHTARLVDRCGRGSLRGF